MATVRERAIEKQINEVVARAQLAGVTMNDLKDQHCGLHPCLYKDQVKGLGPIAYDSNDLACVFPCGKKCHGHCYGTFLKNGNDDCPFHGKTCAAQGGRRRSKRSKRSTRSKRSIRSKRTTRSKRSKRSKRSYKRPKLGSR